MHADFYEKWFTRSKDINGFVKNEKMSKIMTSHFHTLFVSTVTIFMNVIILRGQDGKKLKI